MFDIASIRSKIVRMNLFYGETFASALIPIIVNTDGSASPTGPSLDTSVNYLSTDYVNIGSVGGFNIQNAIKYIDTGFDPSLYSDIGQNDASYGIYGINNVGNNGNLGLWGSTNFRLTLGTPSVSAINNTGVSTVNVASSKQYSILSRNNSANFDFYQNGVKTNYTSASTTKISTTVKIGMFAAIGVAFYFNTNGGYFIGKALTVIEEATLRTAWASVMTKLGRI
jgi:hypothetical protein